MKAASSVMREEKLGIWTVVSEILLEFTIQQTASGLLFTAFSKFTEVRYGRRTRAVFIGEKFFDIRLSCVANNIQLGKKGVFA